VSNGILFGTTDGGGKFGEGTVFAVTTSGTEHVVYGFGQTHDGGGPEAGLTPLNGTLFGTTNYGGGDGDGTVFSVTPAGAERVLHSFTLGADGGYPGAGALTALNGTLFGAVPYGGADDSGVVFEVTPAGALKVLHTFTYGTDGGFPGGSLLDVSGVLYGTAEYGGASNEGSVFRILP